jgi:glycosyltransferase involved in cell wall biosynthesis
MSCGLPVVAFDCPIGPRAIINPNENGFLIQDGNFDDFAEKLELLMQNSSKRIEMGTFAKKSVSKYNLDVIMEQWNNLFQNYQKH